jgi:hypothetical protein
VGGCVYNIMRPLWQMKSTQETKEHPPDHTKHYAGVHFDLNEAKVAVLGRLLRCHSGGRDCSGHKSIRYVSKPRSL